MTRCISSLTSAVGEPPAAKRNLSSRPRARSLTGVGLERLGEPEAGGAAEHDQVGQAVRAEPVGAVDRDAGRLADGEQARDDRVRIAVLRHHDLATIIGRDAAHIVVGSRHDRQRLTRQIDAGENLAGLGDARQAFGEDFGRDMVEVQVNMVLVRADAAALADFDRHGA